MREKMLPQPLVDMVSTLPGAHLVVKVHPGDHTGVTERVLSGVRFATVALSGDSLDHLTKCDVAIITSSTTGLEAMCGWRAVGDLGFH